MKIFKELKKLGYKHYTEHTIEELDNLPLNSEERIMEQALVLRWFRENTEYIGFIEPSIKEGHYDWVIVNDDDRLHECEEAYQYYEEAELACLKKLIEIVKEKQS